jgi:hypothetical protein
MIIKRLLIAVALCLFFSSSSFNQSSSTLTQKSNFLDVFMDFDSGWLIYPYRFLHFRSDIKIDEQEDKLNILDYGGTVVDFINYSMNTQYPCWGWSGQNLTTFKTYPGTIPTEENCINSVDFAVWKSSSTGSIFVGISNFENNKQTPLDFHMYEYRKNKWREVDDLSRGEKQLPSILQRKFPQVAKKKHAFRYILPGRGNIIRVAVTWSDTGDYKNPQLLDIAYIKLINGKFVFTAL